MTWLIQNSAFFSYICDKYIGIRAGIVLLAFCSVNGIVYLYED